MVSSNNKTSLIFGLDSYLPLLSPKKEINNQVINHHLNSLNQMIETLSNLNSVKATIHFTSSIISYLDKKYPNFSSQVINLLNNNQLELLSGGMYEPIFPLIPQEDRQNQFSLMNRLLHHIYGYTPSGAWITELAWEPSIAFDLAKSRINYTCLSKKLFMEAGLNEKDIDGYYITEEEGRKIGVFPITYELNTFVQTTTPQETIQKLIQDIDNKEKSLVVIFYRGLFTNESQFQWIKAFIEGLEKTQANFETTLLSHYFSSNKPRGRIYLPENNNTHNGDKAQKNWRNYLLKYHEANLLHKKMLRVSKKINAAKEGKFRFKVIKEMISQAQDLLLQGQCHNAYWDNTTCGIYLPIERHITYQKLIKAENLIDASSRKNSKWVQISEIDYDCDGNDELIIESDTQNIYISPALGGSIIEHDFRPKNINLINTIARRFEPYHLENNLIYDSYPKFSLIDHFLKSDLNLEKFIENKLEHLTEKIIYPYNVEKIKAKEDNCKISLSHSAELKKLEGDPQIELTKSINTRSGDNALNITYRLTNKSLNTVNFTFAVEFNLNPSGTTDENAYFESNDSSDTPKTSSAIYAFEELKEIKHILLNNKTQNITIDISWNHKATIYRYPIETYSYHYKSLKKIIQGITIISCFNLTLDPGMSWELQISQNIKSSTEDY